MGGRFWWVVFVGPLWAEVVRIAMLKVAWWTEPWMFCGVVHIGVTGLGGTLSVQQPQATLGAFRTTQGVGVQESSKDLRRRSEACHTQFLQLSTLSHPRGPTRTAMADDAPSAPPAPPAPVEGKPQKKRSP